MSTLLYFLAELVYFAGILLLITKSIVFLGNLELIFECFFRNPNAEVRAFEMRSFLSQVGHVALLFSPDTDLVLLLLAQSLVTLLRLIIETALEQVPAFVTVLVVFYYHFLHWQVVRWDVYALKLCLFSLVLPFSACSLSSFCESLGCLILYSVRRANNVLATLVSLINN